MDAMKMQRILELLAEATEAANRAVVQLADALDTYIEEERKRREA